MSQIKITIPAIKAAAKAIDSESPCKARDAVRAILRSSRAVPSFGENPGRSFSIDKPFTIISSCAGSGKSEAMHAWQRKMAAAGHRQALITQDTSFFHRWNPRERSMATLRRKIDHLWSEGRDLLTLVAPLHPQREKPSWTAKNLLAAFEGRDVKNAVVTIRDMDTVIFEAQDIIADLVQVLLAEGNKVIIETHAPTSSQRLSVLLQKDPEIIQGLSSSPVPGIEDVQTFSPGQFAMLRDGVWHKLRAHYDGEMSPPPAAGEDALDLADRINSALQNFPSSTHTERLELISKACGYRSWHAAEGHLKKPPGRNQAPRQA